MPATRVNGQTLWFEDTGGSGPVVVLSHGFLMDREMFADNVAALVPAYRCVVWDQRGFGRTGPVDTPFTYWDSARDLLGLLDNLAIERAALVGMSQGGFISMRAALLDPNRVTALVLVDTRSGTDAPEVIEAFAGLDAEWQKNGARNVKDDLADLLGVAHASERWFPKWESLDVTALHHAIGALKDRDDITAQLKSIVAHCLVIHGDADKAIALEHGAALRDELPNCKDFLAVAGAGHASNMQFPDAVNTALREFLDRHVVR
jgi:pimeloyl-ACP methyl ester carboxylesterase